ncbi:hypothetical protein CEXT_288481 [Caerostris extrusa]|uniref:Uncharacterized protein n=1 Tax=Caerostris extrusa TaxID=172846 RepID=A0AAV4W2D4_CAEEX|nr:hypothetical protein CEXT_288481 [Caerostris extrusa]
MLHNAKSLRFQGLQTDRVNTTSCHIFSETKVSIIGPLWSSGFRFCLIICRSYSYWPEVALIPDIRDVIIADALGNN